MIYIRHELKQFALDFNEAASEGGVSHLSISEIEIRIRVEIETSVVLSSFKQLINDEV